MHAGKRTLSNQITDTLPGSSFTPRIIRHHPRKRKPDATLGTPEDYLRPEKKYIQLSIIVGSVKWKTFQNKLTKLRAFISLYM